MEITIKLTPDEEKAIELAGSKFQRYVERMAQNKLDLLFSVARKKVMANKSLTEIEDFAKRNEV